ncbi:uncharacterized protein BYT42DRAFT_570610 [Radiomyces spectabilis]|uniref:uncharacterized protein n=1 Tax=Radiomyces spectabilis TaxID=64574 RepID=UPI00221FD957|nr:uncharacterized protein BYT42DRAFT_570610 [Radiomyces spectabilis]KAI8377527.1 hypothetical protein BYT42DRAFT_570610 [Radiomyces spectabilis]
MACVFFDKCSNFNTTYVYNGRSVIVFHLSPMGQLLFLPTRQFILTNWGGKNGYRATKFTANGPRQTAMMQDFRTLKKK